MTVVTRSRAHETDPAPATGCSCSADLAVLARVLARVIVRTAPGGAASTFRHIATIETRDCSPAEAAVIERLCGG